MEIVALICGIVGIIGSIVPGLPGPPVSWVGLLLLLFLPSQPITLTSVLIWLAVTAVITILDYVIPAKMAQATGGHKAASAGALIGLLAGIFLTPIGMLAGSLLGAFIGELAFVDGSTVKSSVKASIGAFLGFITGTFMKIVVSGIMLYQICRCIFS